MISPNIFSFIAYLIVSYVAVALAKHWVKIQRMKRPPLNRPVLNLVGNAYDNAERIYFSRLRDVLFDGYRRYKHDFYQLFSPTGYLVVGSADFVGELSQLPEGTLDFHSASQKRMIGDYNWLQIADDLLAHTIRIDLTKKLESLLPEIYEEVDYCIRIELPPCQVWTPVTIQNLTPRLIAIVIGRILVGPSLNREEKWIRSVTQFVADVYIGGLKLKGYSHFNRPFAARFLIPEIRRVWRHQAMARRKLLPLLAERSTAKVPSADQQSVDLLQWLLKNNSKWPQPRTLNKLADLVSVAYVGSTNTVATTLANLLLDMAARPRDLEILREEAIATQVNTGLNCPVPSLSIEHTSKLDSFMKESQRLNPAHLVTFSRIVRKPFTLTNGIHLPTGAHLIIPACMISLDKEFYESPEDFQGFRFSDARTTTALHNNMNNKSQFTTTSPQAMHFGYGRNACPGRFLASKVIKAFAVCILVNFDLKLVGERPISQTMGARNSPPRDAQIMLRKRDNNKVTLRA